MILITNGRGSLVSLIFGLQSCGMKMKTTNKLTFKVDQIMLDNSFTSSHSSRQHIEIFTKTLQPNNRLKGRMLLLSSHAPGLESKSITV